MTIFKNKKFCRNGFQK